jgi:hypothetical protein
MAATVTRCAKLPQQVGGTLARKFEESSCTEKFLIVLSESSIDLPAIATLANLFANSAFPKPGDFWPTRPGYGWYADKFQFEAQDEAFTIWHCTVSYNPLKPGEPNTDGVNDDPLLYPPTYWLEFIEFEEPITQARNVEEIGNDTKKGKREALTLGPVVNGALQEFEEPLMKTTRQTVLCMQRNYPSLDEILDIDDRFSDTCNSDAVYGREARQLEYIGIESGGVQTSNEIDYYSGVVRVKVTKSTDREILNLGWRYWSILRGDALNPDEKVESIFKVDELDDDGKKTGEKIPAPEPSFLNLRGGKSTEPTSLHYRYLREVPYSGLLL